MALADSLRALTRNQKVAIGVVALAVVALFVGVVLGGGDGDESAASTSTSSTTSTTIALPPPSPLTGLPQPDQARRSRPALVVKVDNTDKAMSVQEGLERADLVFVEQTEQGTTRLAAVYQSEDTTVGPVRSARTSDVGIASALNRPLLAYSGANSGVLRQVRRGPLVDVGIDAAGVTAIYQRNQRGGTANLLRYFLPTGDIYDARGADGGPAPALFAYRKGDVEAGGDKVKGIRVGYGGSTSTTVGYEWDADLEGWARTQNNRVHVMAGGGARIAPENVVVLVTPYRSSGFVDVTGAVSPEAVLEGGGDAYYLSDGLLVQGRWSRVGPNAPFTFTGPLGAPIELTPGRTWIELAPGSGSVTVLEAAPPKSTSTTKPDS